MEYTRYATDPELPAIHTVTHTHANLTQRGAATTSACDN